MAGLLAGCAGATFGPDLGGYEIDRSERARTADWPRLIDIPDAPAPGTYTQTAPNPETGAVQQTVLRAEARRLRALAEALAEPVLTEAERRRLTRR
ncbi:MAG: hypothetical protein AAGC92_16655 [Pseudomonadota bacterium]